MPRSVSAASIPAGTVTAVDRYAVGSNGDYFALGRRCRHLRADLANGSIDAEGLPGLPLARSEIRRAQRPDDPRPARDLREDPRA